MTQQHPPIYYVLQSRKFWSAVVGLLAILYVAWHSGVALDPNTVVNAIMGIVAAYMGATALEDGLTNHGVGNPTTTVSTPAANVTLTTTDMPKPPASDGAATRHWPDGVN